MAIIFDPATKRIILDSVSVTATEIFSRWEDWAALSDNIKYGMVIRQVGSDDLGSGLSIPPYFFLQGDWRVRPMEANHNLTITGNLFVEGGGVPVVSTLGTFQVNVNYTVPVQAQGISTSGGSGASAADVWAYANRSLSVSGVSAISTAVRTELDTELDHLLALQNGQGLNTTQATMLLEIYRLYGLDPAKPLVVTQSNRSAGAEIMQSITGNESVTTITRT